MIRKMLKYRLSSESDKDYLKWLKEQYPDKDIHHFTKGFKGKKHNDYLTYPISHEQHDKIHTQGIEDQEEAILLIIDNLIKYIKRLKNETIIIFLFFPTLHFFGWIF